jgi:hypothetical protein
MGDGDPSDRSERPGRELPKDYRRVVEELVTNQEWRYSTAKRHPTLYPPDRSQRPLTLSSTPSDRRAFQNFIARVRQRGGRWPPDEE